MIRASRSEGGEVSAGLHGVGGVMAGYSIQNGRDTASLGPIYLKDNHQGDSTSQIESAAPLDASYRNKHFVETRIFC